MRSSFHCPEAFYFPPGSFPRAMLSGHGKASVVRETLFQCARCRRQTSVTAGTIFQDIRKPLTMWFRAMWYVTSQKNGASALGIQRVLGLGSYQTAWVWLHKLRRAMVRPDRERLSGWIEVDETYLGGLEEGRIGRGGVTKALICDCGSGRRPGHRADSNARHSRRIGR
jgi:hypothetical protein